MSDNVYLHQLHKMGFSPNDVSVFNNLLVNYSVPEENMTYELRDNDLKIISRGDGVCQWLTFSGKKAILPFGTINGKIAVPSAYSWIREKDPKTGEMDPNGKLNLELIYNLTMLSSNINYWYLLRYYQKKDIYDLLKDNPRKKIFQYIEPDFTFTKFYQLLLRIVGSFDEAFTTIMMSRTKHDKISSEEETMIKNNIDRILYMENLSYPFGNKIDFYVLHNILPYRAFLWEFVKDFVVIHKFENAWRLDARPTIKTIYFDNVQ